MDSQARGVSSSIRKNYKSPRKQLGRTDNWPKKNYKTKKNLKMILQHKTELNNATCPQEIVQIGRRRNNRGARDLRLDSGAHPGSPSQLCWGLDGTGQSQPETIREDAVNSPGANPVHGMLLLINIFCNDEHSRMWWTVIALSSAIQANSTTGNHLETLAKGEISKL